MEFHQLLKRLDEIRAAAERERFIEAADQIQAVIDYMRWRRGAFSARERATPPKAPNSRTH